MPQRLAVANLNIEGYRSKVIPGLHFHDDGRSMTMTAMTLENPTDATESDRFLNMTDCRDFLSDPITTSDHKYESYDNLFVKYEDFPGWYVPYFEKTNSIVKIRMKMTFNLFVKNESDKNFVGFMKYIDPDAYPNFKKTSGILMGSLLRFDQHPNEVKQYNLVPTVILKQPGNIEPNLPECDFVLFHSDPGYYCNLELTKKSFPDFEQNYYNDLIVDAKTLSDYKIVSNGSKNESG